jgi:hypothetical protein
MSIIKQRYGARRFFDDEERRSEPEIGQALDLLRRLDEHQIDIGRIYAAAIAERVERCATEGMREVGGQKVWDQLQRWWRPESLPSSAIPPGFDHVSFWRDRKRGLVVMGQPYGLARDTLFELAEMCRREGLEISIDAGRSWHFPGSTVLIQIWRPKD